MEINAKTKVCGLIGYPVGHSVSPVLHNTLAEMYGQNLAYVPLPVEPGKLEDAIKGAEAFGFLGMNVTVPYKSGVIPYLKEMDSLAEQIGAVNTLVQTEGGYKGYNTDILGMYRAMQSAHVPIEGEEVLLLGAGGAARAAAFLMLQKGAGHVTILNRSTEKAGALADEVNRAAKEQQEGLSGLGNAAAWTQTEEASRMAGRQQDRDDFVSALPLDGWRELPQTKQYIVIQATNVGMYPDVGKAVIEEEAFYRLAKVGFDVIFNPANTKFMQLVEAAGGQACNGLKMLLYQGITAYELWTGAQISEDAAEAVYRKIGAALGL